MKTNNAFMNENPVGFGNGFMLWFSNRDLFVFECFSEDNEAHMYLFNELVLNVINSYLFAYSIYTGYTTYTKVNR